MIPSSKYLANAAIRCEWDVVLPCQIIALYASIVQTLGLHRSDLVTDEAHFKHARVLHSRMWHGFMDIPLNVCQASTHPVAAAITS